MSGSRRVQGNAAEAVIAIEANFSTRAGGGVDLIMKHANAENFFATRAGTDASTNAFGDSFVLDELVKVLSPHPGGLRRFSVMRAIRVLRDRSSRPISLKFEAEIERAFRSACANWSGGKPPENSDALFYRPEGKAGEVWAVYADRASAWLAGTADAR
jgi:hypothetical protein